ncbi:GNAT family N-acetyltransferase [Humibacter albus]|uniref:GNAT family N-acetyltransferase n=1 Tax=Humibacter albus TaxID=427754 RepID=UPI0003B4EB70|nr:GNAT family N-acetyltransferase [Humibacter albus]
MDAHELALDPASTQALAARDLRLGLVDSADRDQLAAWHEADSRGFHDRRPEQQSTDELREHSAGRRITGVWDDAIPESEVPVATVSSWVAGLSVPGGSLDAWAISSVTVAPTHRRRGVARALLEGELRTAAAAGVPVAALTVSEATIYSRYGFGAATWAADFTLDTRRAGWVSTIEPSGRLAFVSLQTAEQTCRDVFTRAWAATPGDMVIDDLHWGSLTGVYGDRDKRSASLRAVRYDDADGIPQGVVVYRLKENHADFTKHTVEVEYLRAATDEAYAALWRYLIELDLVSTLHHGVASPDEAVLWMIRDLRAATVTPYDHHWLRILDVPTALQARRYAAPLDITFRIDDPLGFTDGTFRLLVGTDGSGRVERTDASPDLSMAAPALASLYLGGVRTATLARAGRVVELVPGAVARWDAAFASAQTPWLSYWY